MMHRYRLHLLLFLVLPLAFMSVFVLYLVQKEIEHRSMVSTVIRLDSIRRGRVDATIGTLEEMLRVSAQDERLDDLERDSEALSLVSDWDKVRAIFPSMGAVSYLSINDNKSLISKELGHGALFLQRGHTLWMDQKGQPGDVLWASPYQDTMALSSDMVGAITGVYGKDGLMGIMSVYIPIHVFLSAFKEDDAGGQAKILVVTEDHRVITFDRQLGEPVEYSGLLDWNELVHDASGHSMVKIGGKRYYAFNTAIQPLGFYLVSLIPFEQYRKELYPFLFLVFTINVLCSFAVFIAVGGIIRKIIGNIQCLCTYMAGIDFADFKPRICVYGKDEFMELNTSLNRMVYRLDSALKELEYSNQEKERLIELRTSLLHIIGHNTATPITVLSNISRELSQESPETEDFRHLALVAGNLKTMMENIMVFLKLDEGGAFGTHHEHFDLYEETQLILKTYNFPAQTKKISFHCDLPSMPIQENRFLVRTVCENLIDNGVKFSPSGGRVVISGERTAHGVIWRIGDEGPGFSQEDQKHLFGKFSRLSAQPSGGERSMGLGLYIVKQLMESIGGSIILHPQASGAHFSLFFPQEQKV